MDQAEDCQNKYGVRVIVKFDDDEVDKKQDEKTGARDLVNQLVTDGGVGQGKEGYSNVNLRVVDDQVVQLVDQSDLVEKHYFDF